VYSEGGESCDLNVAGPLPPVPSYHVYTSPLPKDACPKNKTYTLDEGQVFSDTYVWSVTGGTTLYLLSPEANPTDQCDLSETAPMKDELLLLH